MSTTKAEVELPRNGGPPAQSEEVKALADGIRPTDRGNARRLAELHSTQIRWVWKWGKWVVYADGRWHLDHGDTIITQLAKDVARQLYAIKGADADTLKWAKSCESANTIRNMVRLTRGVPGVACRHEDFDKDPWLLNCDNGTVDLRTGALVEHNPEHLITKTTSIEYDPDAEAPLWEAFLERILPDDDIREYVHRYAGYAATGLIREQIFPIWWGEGANGKSTLIESLRYVLGEYAMAAAKDLMMSSKYETHATKYADLFRVRLATTVETRSGSQLDESRVKELTGGDMIKARRMREDYWHFEPTHKLLLATNHKPQIEGTDHAIWRRVHLVPFTEVIPDEEQDLKLPEKLRQQEAAGILAWLVSGCLAWQERGLDVPESVMAATRQYRGESDLAQRFIDEAGITLSPIEWCRAAELSKAHEEWCGESGQDHQHLYPALTDRLKQLGVKRQKKGGIRGWQGIGIPAASDG